MWARVSEKCSHSSFFLVVGQFNAVIDQLYRNIPVSFNFNVQASQNYKAIRNDQENKMILTA